MVVQKEMELVHVDVRISVDIFSSFCRGKCHLAETNTSGSYRRMTT